MQPSQPSGVTIVNGAPAQGDHSRKPSVTISSAGTSGYIPNGGPAGSARIQFGDLPQSPSQSITSSAPQATQTPSNNLGVSPSPSHRVPSPQDPPSPIPQHTSSGGRPPSSFQYQGNNMNMSFGSMNSNEDVSLPNFVPSHSHSIVRLVILTLCFPALQTSDRFEPTKPLLVPVNRAIFDENPLNQHIVT